MLERLWDKGNTPKLLVGVQAGTALLDINLAISQKIRQQPTSRLSNTTFGYISEGCSIITQGHVLNYVYSNIVCDSCNLKTTSIPLDQRMDKVNLHNVNNGVLHSRKIHVLKLVDKSVDLKNII